jgi:hypothetical protein
MRGVTRATQSESSLIFTTPRRDDEPFERALEDFMSLSPLRRTAFFCGCPSGDEMIGRAAVEDVGMAAPSSVAAAAAAAAVDAGRGCEGGLRQ